MGVKNPFKKDYIIGLDIGSTSIKIVQFAEKEDGLHLMKADLKELGEGGGDSFEDKAISALKNLFRGIDLNKSRVVVAVNCHQTAIKRVITPYMPKSELRAGVMLESKNYFPFPIDESSLDFEILGDVVEKGIRKREVLVGVCPLHTVNRYLPLLAKASIKPSSFVSTSYCLYKLAEKQSPAQESIECFIDIGSVNTELTISKGNVLLFSRKIPVSGNDFTKAMTNVLISDRGKTQLTLTEAEKIKLEVGIPSEDDKRIIDNKIASSQLVALLRAPAEQMVNEISRCFDYYREESGAGEVDSVTIFGGGAYLGGFVKFLSDGLGMQVKLGDPLEGLKMEKDAVKDSAKITHRMGLAVGAALGGSGGINLLPTEIKEEIQRTVKRGTVEAAVAAAIVASLLFYIGMHIQLLNLEKRISVANLELSSLGPQIEEAEAKKLTEEVLFNEPYWEDIFRELGSLIPDSVVIENMRMENDIITLKGMIASQDGQQILTDFIIALEKGLFSNVKLVGSKNLSNKPGIEFELRCWVDYAK